MIFTPVSFLPECMQLFVKKWQLLALFLIPTVNPRRHWSRPTKLLPAIISCWEIKSAVARTDCGDDAGDFGVAVAASSCECFDGARPCEQTLLVFVRMSQYERRVLLLCDGHVEADVRHLHNVSRTRVQLDWSIWNVLFDTDERHAVSVTRTMTLPLLCQCRIKGKDRFTRAVFTARVNGCWFCVPWTRTVTMGRVREPCHNSALIEYFKRNFANKINKLYIKNIVFSLRFYPLRYI